MTKWEELNHIAKKHGGVLKAKDVVKYAKNPKTKLHKCFEWDDSKAAAKWRLEQAQHIIRCHVIVMPTDDKPVKVRAFQSLPSKRGGQEYQQTADVLSQPSWRQELLETALSDLRSLRKKYEVLKELSSVWSAIDEITVEPKKAANG